MWREAEHYAEILVDTGIAERVGPEAWRDIVAGLIEAIKAGNPARGCTRRSRRWARSSPFIRPARFDDTDELPNKVIVL